MVYFIADTHFGHENIIKYCNRPFKTALDMNNTLIKNWNRVVSNKDIVYHLGDLALCSNEVLEPIIKVLNGKKILIRGNHDSKSIATYENVGLTVLRNPPILLKEHGLILSHIPLPDTSIPGDYINIHGHIHNKLLNEVSYHNQLEMLEYPDELYNPKKHICVSVDVTNFKPVSIDDILDKINTELG